MIGWPIAIVIIGIILLTPFGIRFSYLRSGLAIKAFVGFAQFTIYPSKKKKKPIKAKPEKPQKPTKSKPKTKDKEPFRLVRGDVSDLSHILKRILKGFTRFLKIDKLQICLTPGGEDAAQAALRYGYANAAMGLILPLILQHFRVRNHRCEIRLRYDKPQPVCYAVIQVHINLWRTLIFGFLITKSAVGFLSRHKSRMISHKREKHDDATMHEKTAA